jgi:hypothetical protein
MGDADTDGFPKGDATEGEEAPSTERRLPAGKIIVWFGPLARNIQYVSHPAAHPRGPTQCPPPPAVFSAPFT